MTLSACLIGFARLHMQPIWFSDRVGVVLVANVKGRTKPIDDYDGDSIITEFLSSSELDDLLAAFEQAEDMSTAKRFSMKKDSWNG